MPQTSVWSGYNAREMLKHRFQTEIVDKKCAECLRATIVTPGKVQTARFYIIWQQTYPEPRLLRQYQLYENIIYYG